MEALWRHATRRLDAPSAGFVQHLAPSPLVDLPEISISVPHLGHSDWIGGCFALE
jgi:hypothetical protein